MLRKRHGTSPPPPLPFSPSPLHTLPLFPLSHHFPAPTTANHRKRNRPPFLKKEGLVLRLGVSFCRPLARSAIGSDTYSITRMLQTNHGHHPPSTTHTVPITTSRTRMGPDTARIASPHPPSPPLPPSRHFLRPLWLPVVACDLSVSLLPRAPMSSPPPPPPPRLAIPRSQDTRTKRRAACRREASRESEAGLSAARSSLVDLVPSRLPTHKKNY